MSGPGLDDANIGIPVTERSTDLRALVDSIEGVSLDEPVVYEFGTRQFRELEPNPES